MYSSHPQHFHIVKKQMMENFYLEHIKNGVTDDDLMENDKL